MTHTIDDEALFKAINKWEAEAPIELLLDVAALKEHMINEHGIQLDSWTRNPTVVDEKKYMMFLLRYA